MCHKVLTIPREEIEKCGMMELKVLGSEGELFYEMALEMIHTIESNNREGQKTVFICPVGPVGQYPILVRLVNANKISLKNVWFINMDEYLTDEKHWLPTDHPLSFRGYMQREVYGKIASELIMPPEQRIFPEPGREAAIWDKIRELGGADAAFGGLGINGHIAFNEPPEEDVDMTDDEFQNLPTRILKISRETRTINAVTATGGTIAAMPSWCITIGMKEILSARKIRLFCFREWQRGIVRQAAFGPVSRRVPASFLQQHPDAKIFLTETAAGLPF